MNKNKPKDILLSNLECFIGITYLCDEEKTFTKKDMLDYLTTLYKSINNLTK